MENLPYELLESVLKYIPQIDVLVLSDSTKIMTLFRYLLQYCKIIRNDQKFKKLVITNMTVSHDVSQYKRSLRKLNLTGGLETDLSDFKKLRYLKAYTNKKLLFHNNLKSLKIHHIDQNSKDTISNVTCTSLSIPFFLTSYPSQLRQLEINSYCEIQNISHLPNTITKLILRGANIKNISSLPSNLKNLAFGTYTLSLTLPTLPLSLRSLEITSNHSNLETMKSIIASNVSYLKYRVYKHGVNHNILNRQYFMDKLTKITIFEVTGEIHTNENQIFNFIFYPINLVSLRIDTMKNIGLYYLPKSLTHIKSYVPFVLDGEIPKQITKLYTVNLEINLPPTLKSLFILRHTESVTLLPVSLIKLTIYNSIYIPYKIQIKHLINLKRLHISGKFEYDGLSSNIRYLRLYIFNIFNGNAIITGDLPQNLILFGTNLCFDKLPKSLKYLTCRTQYFDKVPKWVKYVYLS